MQSMGIVPELDVPSHVLTGVIPGRVDGAVDTLVLQRREERLGHGIIVAYARTANRVPQAELTVPAKS